MGKPLHIALVLVLALPPAWCCAAPAAVPATKNQPVPQQSCCGHQHSAPTDDSTPTPPSAGWCCCQKDWKPSPTVDPVLTTALPVELLPITLATPLRSIDAGVVPLFALDPHLHVLQCVWLC